MNKKWLNRRRGVLAAFGNGMLHNVSGEFPIPDAARTPRLRGEGLAPRLRGEGLAARLLGEASRPLVMAMLVGAMALANLVAFGDVTIPEESAWTEPIYTVEVASGDVVDLQSATVTKKVGETVTTQTGIDAATTTGTIVKKGAGELQMKVTRSKFAGAIHIQAGVVRVSCTYPLGGDSAKSYVYEGATLVADFSNPVSIASTSIYGTVFFAGGTGAEGMNGQYVLIPKSTATTNIRAPFAKSTVLGGDTTWNLLGNIVLDGGKKIDLQGHELTFNQVNCPASKTLYLDTILCSNPGGFVFDHLNQASFRDDASNSYLGNGYFKFRGTPLAFNESTQAVYPREWKIIVEDKNQLRARVTGGKSGFPSLGALPNTTRFAFGGLDLPTDMDLVLYSTESADTSSEYAPFAVMGPVTGGGGIVYDAQASRCERWLITLGCSENTFPGGVSLWKNSRLDLLGGGNALPANGGDVKLADGCVLGLSGTGYTLPGAQFDGNVAVSNVVASNASVTVATGAWAKPVVKTGTGVLDYGAAIGGPLLDIRKGTVKLHCFSSVAGLNKGRKWFSDYRFTTNSTSYYGVNEPALDGPFYVNGYFRYTNVVAGVKQDNSGYGLALGRDWDNAGIGCRDVFTGTQTFTNTVARSVDIAYRASTYECHPRYQVYTYTGYVWNDSDTAVTRTLAITFNDHIIIKLNGTQVYKMDEGRQAKTNPARGMVDLTLQPGPNAIEVRTYSDYVSSPNYYACATNGFVDATLDFGMGIADGVTTSDSVADYRRFEDAGDGDVFTTASATTAPPFEKVKLADGAILDLNIGARGNYVTASFDEIEGVGSIVGGDFTVGEKLLVATNAAGKVSKLTVAGKLTFAAGATVSLAEGTAITLGDEYTILEAGAIDGTPTLDSALANHWKLVNTGRKLKLVAEISQGGESLEIPSGQVVKYALAGWDAVAGLNKGMKWFCGYEHKEGQKASAYYYGIVEPAMDGDDLVREGGYFRYTNVVEGVRDDDTGYWIRYGYDWDNDVGNSTYFAGTKCVTNKVVGSIDIAYNASTYKCHPRNSVYTYTGYIWNDADTAVTRTLAITFNDHIIIKLNGTQVYKMDSGHTAESNPDRGMVNLTLQPGPNALEVRCYNQYVSPPNYYACATNGFVDATLDFGMGIADGVTTSDSVYDYRRFEDAGDGKLFTTAIETMATPFVYDTLTLAEGATLDLNNTRGAVATYGFGDIVGTGTITNGEIEVTNSLTVAKADLEAGKALVIAGKLNLGEDAVIKIAGNEQLDSSVTEYVVAIANGGIEGTIKLDPSYPYATKWKVFIDGCTIKIGKQGTTFYLW